jgi:TetR/AcrR family transcriptional regulator, regulator of autoinduction and epiphytic fitness
VPSSSPTTATPGRTRSRTDGRTERGVRARQSIAEALVSVLQDGVTRPTARQVAERAGVSLRLVFHHFEDMESLLEAAVDVQVQRHWRKLEPIDLDGALSQRVRSTVAQRAQLFEAIAPVRRAAARASGSSPTLARQLDLSRRLLRSQLRETFCAELSNQVQVGYCSGRDALDALEVATSFETWDQLRRQSGRSSASARQVVEHLAFGALGRLQASPHSFGDRREDRI